MSLMRVSVACGCVFGELALVRSGVPAHPPPAARPAIRPGRRAARRGCPRPAREWLGNLSGPEERLKPRLRWRHSTPPARCRRPRSACQASRRQGKASRSGASKSSRPWASRSSPATPDSIRCGQPRPTASEVRMSGRPSWARVEPSTNSTSECTRLCGCTSTRKLVAGHAEQMVGFDQLQALVHQRGRIHRDLRPHRPFRVGDRLLPG